MPIGSEYCAVGTRLTSHFILTRNQKPLTEVAGLVVLMTLIAGWRVAIARGQNGNPYDWLLAISGLTYLIALAFFRWRG